jgi:hypothetical protein
VIEQVDIGVRRELIFFFFKFLINFSNKTDNNMSLGNTFNCFVIIIIIVIIIAMSN